MTEEEYQGWLSILDEVEEEAVDRDIVARGMGGLCVEVQLAIADADPYGIFLEAVVENIGPYPIGEVQVLWHGKWDAKKHGDMIGQGFPFVLFGVPPTQLL